VVASGSTIPKAAPHRDDGKRFVVRADEKLTAFVELEETISVCDQLCLTSRRGFSKLGGMNPSKVAVSLLFLTISLLLLGGCEGMPESNTPAFVPNPQPGAPIPGGLRIVSAHASPLFDDFGSTKTGTVNVHFNGAATKTVYVDVSARVPGSSFYTDVSGIDGVLRPGQTDCQVRIKVSLRDVSGDVQIPLKVTTRGSGAGEFETMTHYRGKP
jgi:hypothetical protein